MLLKAFSGVPLALNTPVDPGPALSVHISQSLPSSRRGHIHIPGSLRAIVSALPSAWSALPQPIWALPYPPSSSPLQLKHHFYIPTSQSSPGLFVPGTPLWLMNLALCRGLGWTEGGRASWHLPGPWSSFENHLLSE